MSPPCSWSLLGAPPFSRLLRRSPPCSLSRTAAAGSLEFFLLERYHLYAARGNNLFRGTVAHTPYEFREAGLRELSTVPATLDGFPDLDPQPRHVCHADGVDVRILALEKVS
jgi:uncharacterized protein YqjF (DUF2071 family)